MPKVIAYQSNFDKRVYSLDQRDKYINHLKKIRQKNTDKRQMAKALIEFESFRDNAAETLSTIEEIEQWITNNMKTIAYSHMALTLNSFDTLSPNAEMLKIHFEDMQYDDCIRNSHNAPRNGVTNWEDNFDKPSGYPGLRGRIHMLIDSYDKNKSSDISTILTKLGICTGSGGSGRFYTEDTQSKSQCSLSYEVILFDSDWPCLAVTRKMNS